jgi:hypothetical protein
MLFKLNTFAIMALCLNSVIAAPLPADSTTQVAAAAGVFKEVREAAAANNLADPASFSIRGPDKRDSVSDTAAPADVAYGYEPGKQDKK